MTDVQFRFRKGAGSNLDVLFGTVTLKPTLAHSRGTSMVLPAPSTWDIINGEVLATNVQPTPEPVDGVLEWGYEVTVKDRHGKSYSFLVGVPDSTTAVEFVSLPRYFETKPPLFGQGPKGDAGEAATVTVGTVTKGTEASVSNSGTSNDAILDFVLPQGPKGDKGDNSTYLPLNSKVFADAPSTYPNGISVVRSANSTAGWPYSVSSVTTSYAGYAGGAWQIIKDSRTNNSSATYIRFSNVGSVDTWGPLQPLVNDLASSTVNGLMSSADKAKLDGIGTLAYASKKATDLADTYPEGTTVGAFKTADGWPAITGGDPDTVTIKTEVPRGYPMATQWAYPYKNDSSELLQTSPVMYRQGYGSLGWGSWETVATTEHINNLVAVVTPEQFGAKGDGAADDSSAIESALDFAKSSGRDLVLDSNKTYKITRTITNTAPVNGQRFRVSIRSNSNKPAKIITSGNVTPMIHLKGAQVATTNLTANTNLQQRRWTLADTSKISSGSLLGIVSSLSWYYDPRPESTDARKSELHRVLEVEGNDVHTESPSNDGYMTAYETTEARIIQPIEVFLSNLELGRPAPAYGTASDGARFIGIRVDFADNPVVEGVKVTNSTATAIQIRNSYQGVVRRCNISGSNNYFEGYGVTISGSSFTVLEDSYITNGRRAADVSSGNNIISHNVTIRNCTYVGGGKNSRGNWSGWNPTTNALGDRNAGFGSHSAADHTTVEGCLTINCLEPYVVRGANSTYRNNTHIGRTNVAVFGIAEGGGVTLIQGNQVLSGWMGTPKYQFQETSRRANAFLKTYSSYDLSDGRIVVQDNYAEVSQYFALLGTISPAEACLPRYLNITNNRIGLADGTTEGGTILYNPGGTLVAAGNRWTIGPNEIRHDTNAGTPKLTYNINIAGSKVLEYSISGTTS